MSHPWIGTPMGHQINALKKAWPLRQYALYHEMGSGKTYTAINLAAARFNKSLIDRIVIICPTSIKLVWEEEFKEWCPCQYSLLTVEAGMKAPVVKKHGMQKNRLKVLVVGVEALSTGKAFDHAYNFLDDGKAMTVVDEGQKIKSFAATRTKKAIKLGERSVFRLLMTGTPITQGAQDLYSQMQFLGRTILGIRSYTLFKNRYCIMGGFENRNIVGYNDLDDLMEKVAPWVDIVRKVDVMDLPDKIYQKRYVKVSKEQEQAIEELKDLFEATVEGDRLTANTVLERLTRYQQIIGGNFPYENENGDYETKPLPKGSPKIDEMLDVISEIPNDCKIIIWARFRPEIALIVKRLQHIYGCPSTVEYHGGVDTQGRRDNVSRFRQDKRARFFISNQATGGTGLTLNEATYVIYYSNTFSYEDRRQSEDRNHRRGQDNHVTYVDIEADHPYDKMILKAIHKKGGVATWVNDTIRELNQ